MILKMYLLNIERESGLESTGSRLAAMGRSLEIPITHLLGNLFVR
jgi:hypothetical protein